MSNKIKSLRVIFFSPTKTTQKIAQEIAKGCGFENYRESDLTTPQKRAAFDPKITEDLVIIAMPVYEEHIPHEILPLLNTIEGKNQPMIGVALYGNIGYGMALKDFSILSEQVNLNPVAYGAFIGEHSFSRPDTPVARNRPDQKDLLEAEAFGKEVAKQLSINMLPFPKKLIPGHLPFMARILPQGSAKWFTVAPAINTECNQCNACIHLCPMGAIDEALLVDNSLCIRCFACVKRCPKTGRSIEYKKSFLVKHVLKRGGRMRKDNLTMLMKDTTA